MRHIFLTGEIQIGKSTVIRRALALSKPRYGGFETYFSADRSDPNRRLFIDKAGITRRYDVEGTVARFSHDGPPQAYPERFDTLGSQLIRSAALRCQLIVMDELGNLENEAVHFQSSVFDALEGDVPILGVIKLSSNGWVEKIRSHPNVALITVDERNRDGLPESLAGLLR